MKKFLINKLFREERLSLFLLFITSWILYIFSASGSNDFSQNGKSYFFLCIPIIYLNNITALSSLKNKTIETIYLINRSKKIYTNQLFLLFWTKTFILYVLLLICWSLHNLFNPGYVPIQLTSELYFLASGFSGLLYCLSYKLHTLNDYWRERSYLFLWYFLIFSNLIFPLGITYGTWIHILNHYWFLIILCFILTNYAFYCLLKHLICNSEYQYL